MNVILPRAAGCHAIGSRLLPGCCRVVQKHSYATQAPAVHGKAPISSSNPSHEQPLEKTPPPLAGMPTPQLLRSVVLTSIMASPTLFRPCLAFMGLLTQSRSAVLDPARNPLLSTALRLTAYDHFCAGSSPDQVVKTVKGMKDIGLDGVILGYGKEIVLGGDAAAQGGDQLQQMKLDVVEQWKQGTLKTLTIIGSGDILAIKFTGAGPLAVEALKAGQPMPPAVAAAMDEICEDADRRGVHLWLDAEQQEIQSAIDSWTIHLMRKYNRDGKILVYNTIQAYLKGARANVERHLRLAADEGWGLGIKLVRGAYIEHETRALIHDTKEDTDDSYNDIASSLIEKRLPGDPGRDNISNYPHTALFLATHNKESVQKAFGLYKKRCDEGKPMILLECGQLQGMADEITYELVQANKAYAAGQQGSGARAMPKVFKCLSWGSISECMHFLYRRAIENKGAVTRTKHMAEAMRGELWRRVLRQ